MCYVDTIYSKPLRTNAAINPPGATYYFSGDGTISSGDNMSGDRHATYSGWTEHWRIGNKTVDTVHFVAAGSAAAGPKLDYMDLFLSPAVNVLGFDIRVFTTAANTEMFRTQISATSTADAIVSDGEFAAYTLGGYLRVVPTGTGSSTSVTRWSGNTSPYIRLCMVGSGVGGTPVWSVQVSSSYDGIEFNGVDPVIQGVVGYPHVARTVLLSVPSVPAAVFGAADTLWSGRWCLDPSYNANMQTYLDKRYLVPVHANILPVISTYYDYDIKYALWGPTNQMGTDFMDLDSIGDWMGRTQAAYDEADAEAGQTGDWKQQLGGMVVRSVIDSAISKVVGKIGGALAKKYLMKKIIGPNVKKWMAAMKKAEKIPKHDRIPNPHLELYTAAKDVAKSVTQGLSYITAMKSPAPALGANGIPTSARMVPKLSALLPVDCTAITATAIFDAGKPATRETANTMSALARSVNKIQYDTGNGPTTVPADPVPTQEEFDRLENNDMKLLFDWHKPAFVYMFGLTQWFTYPTTSRIILGEIVQMMTGDILPTDAFNALTWEEAKALFGHLWTFSPDTAGPPYSSCSIAPLAAFVNTEGNFWDDHFIVTRGSRGKKNVVYGDLTQEDPAVDAEFAFEGFSIFTNTWELLPTLALWDHETDGATSNSVGISYIASPNIDPKLFYVKLLQTEYFYDYYNIRISNSSLGMTGRDRLYLNPTDGGDEHANIDRNAIWCTSVPDRYFGDQPKHSFTKKNNFTLVFTYSNNWWYPEYYRGLAFQASILNVGSCVVTISNMTANSVTVTVQQTGVNTFFELMYKNARGVYVHFAWCYVDSDVDVSTNAYLYLVTYSTTGYVARAVLNAAWEHSLDTTVIPTFSCYTLGASPVLLTDASAVHVVRDGIAHGLGDFVLTVPVTSLGYSSGVGVYFTDDYTSRTLMVICKPPILTRLTPTFTLASPCNSWSNRFNVAFDTAYVLDMQMTLQSQPSLAMAQYNPYNFDHVATSVPSDFQGVPCTFTTSVTGGVTSGVFAAVMNEWSYFYPGGHFLWDWETANLSGNLEAIGSYTTTSTVNVLQNVVVVVFNAILTPPASTLSSLSPSSTTVAIPNTWTYSVQFVYAGSNKSGLSFRVKYVASGITTYHPDYCTAIRNLNNTDLPKDNVKVTVTIPKTSPLRALTTAGSCTLMWSDGNTSETTLLTLTIPVQTTYTISGVIGNPVMLRSTTTATIIGYVTANHSLAATLVAMPATVTYNLVRTSTAVPGITVSPASFTNPQTSRQVTVTLVAASLPTTVAIAFNVWVYDATSDPVLLNAATPFIIKGVPTVVPQATSTTVPLTTLNTYQDPTPAFTYQGYALGNLQLYVLPTSITPFSTTAAASYASTITTTATQTSSGSGYVIATVSYALQLSPFADTSDLRKNCASFAVWWADDVNTAGTLYRTYTFPTFATNAPLTPYRSVLRYNSTTTVANFTYNDDVTYVSGLTAQAQTGAGTGAISGVTTALVLKTVNGTYDVNVSFADAMYNSALLFDVYVTNQNTNLIKLVLPSRLVLNAPSVLTDDTSSTVTLDAGAYFTYTATLAYSGSDATSFVLHVYNGSETPAAHTTDYASTRTTVSAGAGTMTIAVTVPANDPINQSGGSTFGVYWMDSSTKATLWKTFTMPAPHTFTISNALKGIQTDMRRKSRTRVADVYFTGSTAPTVIAGATSVSSTNVIANPYSAQYTVEFVSTVANFGSVYVTPTFGTILDYDNTLGNKYPRADGGYPMYLWIYDSSTAVAKLTTETYTGRVYSLLSKTRSDYKFMPNGVTVNPDGYFWIEGNPESFNRTNNWTLSWSVTYSNVKDVASLQFRTFTPDQGFITSDWLLTDSNSVIIPSTLSNVVQTSSTSFTCTLSLNIPVDSLLRTAAAQSLRYYCFFTDGSKVLSDAYAYTQWRCIHFGPGTAFAVSANPALSKASENTVMTSTVSYYHKTYAPNPGVNLYPVTSGAPVAVISSGQTAAGVLAGYHPPGFTIRIVENYKDPGNNTLTVYITVSPSVYTDAALLTATPPVLYNLYMYDDFTDVTLLATNVFVRKLSQVTPVVSASNKILVLRRLNNWADDVMNLTYSGIDFETLRYYALPLNSTNTSDTTCSAAITFTPAPGGYTSKTSFSGVASLTVAVVAPPSMRLTGANFTLWWMDANTALTQVKTYSVPVSSVLTVDGGASISLDASNAWMSDKTVTYTYADNNARLSLVTKLFLHSTVVTQDLFYRSESDTAFQLSWLNTVTGPGNQQVFQLHVGVKAPKVASGVYMLYACDDNTAPVVFATYTVTTQYVLALTDSIGTLQYTPQLTSQLYNTCVDALVVTGTRTKLTSGSDSMTFKALPVNTVVASASDFNAATPISDIYVSQSTVGSDDVLRIRAISTLSCSFRVWALYGFGTSAIDVYLGKQYTSVADTVMALDSPSLSLSIVNGWSATAVLAYAGVNTSSLQFKTFPRGSNPTCINFASLSTVVTTVQTTTVSITPSAVTVRVSCGETDSGLYNIWVFDGGADPVCLTTVTCTPTFTVALASGFPTALNEHNFLTCNGRVALGSSYSAATDVLQWAAFPASQTVTTEFFAAALESSSTLAMVAVAWDAAAGILGVSMSRADAVQYSRTHATFSIWGLHVHNGTPSRVVGETLFTIWSPSIIASSPYEIRLNETCSWKNTNVMLNYNGNGVDTLKVLATNEGDLVTRDTFLGLIPQSIFNTGLMVQMTPVSATVFNLVITSLVMSTRVCNIWVIDKNTAPFVVATVIMRVTSSIVAAASDTIVHKTNNWQVRNTFAHLDYDPAIDTYLWKVVDNATSITKPEELVTAVAVDGITLAVDLNTRSYVLSVGDFDKVFPMGELNRTLHLYCLLYVETYPVQVYALGTYYVYNKSVFTVTRDQGAAIDAPSGTLMQIAIRSQSADTVRFILQPVTDDGSGAIIPS
jgi:type III secretion system FlhB-like substrate exporter